LINFASMKIRLPERIRPALRKKIKKTLIVLVSVAAFLFLSGIIIGRYYEDTVKKIIIEQLNKSLNTEIQVGEIEFSIFRKFPFASVNFYDAVALDATPWVDKENKGKLMEAEEVYLQLSLLDLLFGKYRLKRIELVDAKVNILIFPDGRDNYHFWKVAKDSSDNDFSFDLQKLMLNNVAVSYISKPAKRNDLYHTTKLILKGKFTEKEFELNADGQLSVVKLQTGNEVFLAGKSATVNLVLQVNSEKSEYVFQKGNVYLGGLHFGLTGSFVLTDSIKSADIEIKGRKLDIEDLIIELPDTYRSKFDGYSLDGRLAFEAGIKGRIDGVHAPSVTVNFGISGAVAEEKKSGIRLEKMSFNGFYNNRTGNGNVQTLKLTDFSSELNGGRISGSLSVTDFRNPDIVLKIVADLDFGDVMRFIAPESVASASGRLSIDASYEGKAGNGGRFTMRNFNESRSDGFISFANAEIAFSNSPVILSQLNGRMKFNSNDLETHNLSCSYGSSDFSLDGSFRNLIPYLFLSAERLSVKASLHSKNLVLDELLLQSVNGSDSSFSMELPEHLDFDLSFGVGNFSFRKFSASSLKGNVILRNKQILARNISCRTMDGSIGGTLVIDGTKPGKLLISCDAAISKVDISKLFYQCGNFGQESLKHTNIRGVLDAGVTFASVWSTSLEVDLSTVYAKTDISIQKGELIDYAPLSGLKPYLKGRDLSRVKFSSLKNSIEIKDRTITIPSMTILSDAINFDVYGTHSFKNEIDYHLGVVFADLKNPSDKLQRNEFGIIEDDGLHREKYFFRITGTVENPVYHTIDKEGYKEHLRKKVETEKQTLKDVLNREFGWFKKDSTAAGKDKQKEDKKEKKGTFGFGIEWEEDEDPDNSD
jgi:hypothetical protein